MRFTILPGQVADAPHLLAMIRALAEYERLAHRVTATAPELAASLFGEHPVAQTLIAWESVEKREPLGFALFFPTFSTFLARPGLWLEDLFVREPFRGRGVGRGLLREVAAVARARNCGRLEWSVLDWNRSAIAFYEGMGATVMPDWRIARVTGESLATFGTGAPPPSS